ncbi:DNA polymerase III, tau subunit [Arachidicoccus rhizosphaerae]|uniref:DNA polymerase III subunit gamma/tau n=1 Tax=Arachidicoccus rhizosphaerae TaxID=551991 RepID=A0A1H3WCB3_9BACT|nr:DNA polymerase III subunit gamma/tau [Arachidicoccus rhizosphaerae]SDZ83898.1 DNA polymerase III, tau subunit [Arachidicoccus rhizosphaerae]
MDNFVVSARKYRPQTFDTVVGQGHITTTLKNAIKNGQLAHAFLFCGPRGVGKTTCARILAKTINCENLQPNGEACDQCPSCKSFNEGISLNIHELDAASNNSVDDIRALVEQVRFAPQAGKYKVYIVDEVHMLSSSAFNAFLKTLEEPPSYAIFILATTEKHKILPTILSRCQIFDFKRITNQDTVGHLEQIATKEHIEAEKAALQLIAQKSEGCMRDSLSILDKIVSFTNGAVTYQNTLEHLNILDDEYYFQLLDSLVAQDMASALLLYDQINKKGFEGDIVLNGFAGFIRNLLVCQQPKALELLDVVDAMQVKYKERAGQISASFLVSGLNILNQAEIEYKMARNKRLHVEMALIKLNFLQQAIELSLDESGKVVKKKQIDGPVAYRERKILSMDVASSATGKKTAAPVLNHHANASATGSALYVQPENKTPAATNEQFNANPVVGNLRSSDPISPSEPPASVTSRPVEQKIEGSTGNTLKRPARQNLLDAIKAKVGREYEVREVENPDPLTMEKLKPLWDEFADNLLAQGKHSAANTFNAAKLTIQSEELFQIEVQAVTQKKIIEHEKMMLLDFLQRKFKNRLLTFTLYVPPTAMEVKLPPSSRERFDAMVKKNPALLALKNQLKLNLDY